MKKLLSVFVLLALLAALLPAFAESADTDTAENAQYWREVLQGYRDRDEVQQILLVRYTDDWNAVAQYYVKLPEEGNAWTMVFEETAYVGRNGMEKTREGDLRTPVGDFGVRCAFGIRKNPGTEIDYVDVVESTYCCGCEQYYNQIIDSVETGHACDENGEKMYTYSPEYNYGLFIDYNPDNEVGLGSGIFLHCKGAKPFTGGCVALDEEDMRTVLETADAGLRVVIGYN